MQEEMIEDKSMQVVMEKSGKIMDGPIYEILTLPKVPFDEKISIVTTTLSATLGTFLKECMTLGKVKEHDIDHVLEEFVKCTKDGIDKMRSDDFTRKIMGEQRII